MKNAILFLLPLLLLSCRSDNPTDPTSQSDSSINPTESSTVTDESSSTNNSSEDDGSTSSSSGPDTDTLSTSSSSQSETSTSETSSSSNCVADRELFEGCRYDCSCVSGLCRYNYAGGYLAECTMMCSVDGDCDAGFCSGGYCVRAFCDASTPCAPETFCYPPLTLDGMQLIDPDHPQPHCMSEAS